MRELLWSAMKAQTTWKHTTPPKHHLSTQTREFANVPVDQVVVATDDFKLTSVTRALIFTADRCWM
jgi:hypothetical protein